MTKYRDEIDDMMTLISGSTLIKDWYWSSTECSSSFAWYVGVSGGCIYGFGKANAGRVRPCLSCEAI